MSNPVPPPGGSTPPSGDPAFGPDGTQPAFAAAPAAQPSPADQAGPAGPASAADQAAPAGQPSAADQAAPAAQPSPADQAAPAAQTSPAGQTASAGQPHPAGQPVFPAAGDPAFPAAGDPAFPAAGDPALPAAGGPALPAAGDPAFPAAGDPASFPPPPPPVEQPKKGRALKLIGRFLLVIVVVIGGIALKSAIFGDGAKDAKAGDCISAKKDVKEEGTTKTGASVVDCDSSDAQFTVVARVDGETSLDSPACEKFFKPEEKFFVMASQDGKGYLLCLSPKA